MPKPLPQHESEIFMMVDRETGVLDLRVFATHRKSGRGQIVGTATLRMEDLRELVPMLIEQLQFDQLVKAAAIARKKKGSRQISPGPDARRHR